MKNLSQAELVTYGILCAFAAVVIVPSWKLGLGEKGELGPGFLPFVASLCVLVAGAVLVIFKLIKKQRDDHPAETEKIESKGWLRVFGIMINFTLWPLLVGWIGYILTTFIVSLGIAKSIGYQGWRGPIILSVLIAFSIWLIFGFLFQLDLPAGFSF
jgi:hypothetical protein